MNITPIWPILVGVERVRRNAGVDLLLARAMKPSALFIALKVSRFMRFGVVTQGEAKQMTAKAPIRRF